MNTNIVGILGLQTKSSAAELMLICRYIIFCGFYFHCTMEPNNDDARKEQSLLVNDIDLRTLFLNQCVKSFLNVS